MATLSAAALLRGIVVVSVDVDELFECRSNFMACKDFA
jgi:hypothetical protein